MMKANSNNRLRMLITMTRCVVIALACLQTETLYAQGGKEEKSTDLISNPVGDTIVFRGKKTLVQTQKSTYELYNQKTYVLVVNQRNTLSRVYSYFDMAQDYADCHCVELNNRALLDSLVKKDIYPHLREYHAQSEYTSFDIAIYSNNQGRLCEVMFSYPADANIPLRAIEKLEDDILGSDLKFLFDTNRSTFVRTNSVKLEYRYRFRFMQNGFKREKPIDKVKKQ